MVRGETFLRPPTRGRWARILMLGFLPGLREKTSHTLRFLGSELETWSPAAGRWEAQSDPSSSRSWWDTVTFTGSPGKHRPHAAAQGPSGTSPPPSSRAPLQPCCRLAPEACPARGGRGERPVRCGPVGIRAALLWRRQHWRRAALAAPEAAFLCLLGFSLPPLTLSLWSSSVSSEFPCRCFITS